MIELSFIQRRKTLVNALLAHCKGQLSGINGVARPGIVHRIDPEPVNGVNLITQLLVLLNEVAKDEALMDFFKSQGQKMEKGSSGSVMASTEEGED